MQVDLRTLEPNPMRDFYVDPMDQTVVDRLQASIEEDGFWGGIICRKLPDGRLQIGAGHHRVAAALAAGYTVADVTVSEELDDMAMIRVYARENATQRGNTGAATAGTIASTVRLLAKAVFTNTLETVLINLSVGRDSEESFDLAGIRRHFFGDLGMGRTLIFAFLKKIPGMNEPLIQHQLALLKESGHYDRIIQEVKEDIEREHHEALTRVEEAQRHREDAETRERDAEAKRKAAVAEAKAAREEADRLRAEEHVQLAQIEAELAEKHRKEAEDDAAKWEALRTKASQAASDAEKAAAHTHKKIFNYDGVHAVFTNTHQLRIFRELVTSPTFRRFISYDQQPYIARQFAAKAKAQDEELSGTFIRQELSQLLLEHHGDLGWSSRDRQEFHQVDWAWQWQSDVAEFTRHLRGLTASGQRLARLLQLRHHPPGAAPTLTPDFLKDLHDALEILHNLDARFSEDNSSAQERKTHGQLTGTP